MDQTALPWLAAMPQVTADMRERVQAAYRQGQFASPLPTLLVGEDGRVLAANAQFEQFSGYAASDLYGRSVVDLAHTDDRSAVAEVLARLADRRATQVEYEARWVRRDGRSAWARRHVFRVDDPAGRPAPGAPCCLAFMEDVTAQRLAEREARALLSIGRMIAGRAPLGEVAERLAALAEERWHQAGCSLTVLDESGQWLVPVAHGRLPGGYVDALPPIPVGAEGGACGNAVLHRQAVAINDMPADPRARPFHALLAEFGVRSGWSVPVRDPDDHVVGALGLFHGEPREPTPDDWQALDNLAAVAGLAVYVERRGVQLSQQSHADRHDALTGLPTGLAFTEQVTQGDEAGRPLTVAVARVQGQEGLAAALGESALSDMLAQLAARARDLDAVEAVALLGPVTLGLAARSVWTEREARLLHRALVAPVDLAGLPIRPDVRVGVAVRASGEPTRPETLVHRASLALSGTARTGVYDPREAGEQRALYALSGQVHRALQRRELVLHYQSKYDLRTGQLSGAEALVRWAHPDRGLLAPGAFLRAVALAGAEPELALYVARQALADVPARRERGLTGRVALNFTAEDLRDDLLVEFLCDPAERRWEVLEIELVESSLADAATGTALERLAATGYGISLDDFGTGYSSLSALHSMPLAAVKIDRSFVQRLPGDLSAEALVGAVTAMCGHLGMEVVAEGVETREQLAAVRRLGCTTGQGFLLRRPQPLDQQDAAPVDVPPVADEAPRPAGFDVLPRPVAETLARLRAEQASVHTIAAALNREGFRTPAGSRWHATSVALLIKHLDAGSGPTP